VDNLLPGWHSPVQVRWNGRGVPCLQAQDWDDLWWGLGWVHSRDRRFQMEMQRRLALGRLSEIFSRFTFRADAFMRKLNLLDLCRRE
jgi:penicillin amidase